MFNNDFFLIAKTHEENGTDWNDLCAVQTKIKTKNQDAIVTQIKFNTTFS